MGIYKSCALKPNPPFSSNHCNSEIGAIIQNIFSPRKFKLAILNTPILYCFLLVFVFIHIEICDCLILILYWRMTWHDIWWYMKCWPWLLHLQGSRSYSFEIWCIWWYDVLNFDLESFTSRDQGHLCIWLTLILSRMASTTKVFYLFDMLNVWWYSCAFWAFCLNAVHIYGLHWKQFDQYIYQPCPLMPNKYYQILSVFTCIIWDNYQLFFITN